VQGIWWFNGRILSSHVGDPVGFPVNEGLYFHTTLRGALLSAQANQAFSIVKINGIFTHTSSLIPQYKTLKSVWKSIFDESGSSLLFCIVG
jgi:hypothetical protein